MIKQSAAQLATSESYSPCANRQAFCAEATGKFRMGQLQPIWLFAALSLAALA